MEKRSRVVFCGRSLFMAGLEASLRGREGLEIIRLDLDLPDAQEQLDALCPDVVVLDLSKDCPELALPILKGHPGMPVIGVDFGSNTATVLSSQKYVARTMGELAAVLQKGIASRSRDGDLRREESEEPEES